MVVVKYLSSFVDAVVVVNEYLSLVDFVALAVVMVNEYEYLRKVSDIPLVDVKVYFVDNHIDSKLPSNSTLSQNIPHKVCTVCKNELNDLIKKGCTYSCIKYDL